MDLREAAEIAAGLAAAPREEEIGIESALGRVLARDMAADRDFPGEYRSRWDGYALSGAATSGASHEAPAILAIAAAVVTAGGSAAASPGGSTCFRIMTGAVLPKGTDAVIPFEDAVLSGNQLVLRAPVKRSKGVILPGADAQAGDVLLEKGDVLTPARLALAVAVGANKIHVYKRPRVAILATGDELRATGCDAGGPGVF